MSDLVKASPFSVRDTIQHVLPVVIGAALFAPYLAPPDTFASVLLGAALFSYTLHTPLKKLARWAFWCVPVLRSKSREAEARLAWWGTNWNYDKLFYERIDDKEREYAYLTAGYVHFHRTVAFFLLCYLLLQIAILGVAASDAESVADASAQILRVKTHLGGGWNLPSVSLAPLAAILFATSARDYLSEIGDVETIYARLATKYHGSPDPLAVSVWGWVCTEGQPVPGVEVELVNASGEQLAHATSDKEGKYQFSGMYDAALLARPRIVAHHDGWSSSIQPVWDTDEEPSFRFEKSQSAVTVPESS
ncbi:MAG TPA: hypothetical protein VF647_21540 [Longimicrobium sp.]|jgi:hypothetical protein